MKGIVGIEERIEEIGVVDGVFLPPCGNIGLGLGSVVAVGSRCVVHVGASSRAFWSHAAVAWARLQEELTWRN
jgi:hypothetical protein